MSASVHLSNDHSTTLSEESFPRQFASILRHYVYFHWMMMGTLVIEILALFFTMNVNQRSYFIAIELALFLITLFTYFIVNYYLQTKKPEQLLLLKNQYLSYLRESVGDMHDHLAIAKGLQKMIQLLDENRFQLFETTSVFNVLNRLGQYLVWRDEFFIKEILFFTALEEYHAKIIQHPTDLKVHTALANCYMTFSKLYSPSNQNSSDLLNRMQSKPAMIKSYERVIRLAIEELTILDDYAPNDPWIHAHLAHCYHLLDQHEMEIKEYELLKNLCPNDPEVLFKLGKLYFAQNLNAKGMRLYEKLRPIDENRAKALIISYDNSVKSLFNIKI
ncbi:MAG: hypothetical protein K9M07_00990 [Simkaniaceae bacterium]|nr:hypothetical protein [Simkaniaceae bacterium]